MDDLTICKKIAEIENLMFCTGGRYKRIEIWKDGKVFRYEKFNPLTDDALCFQLMVKYSVDLTHDFSGLWCASMNPTYTYDECVENYGVISYDKSANYAILLAIIEAHKES